MIGTGVFRSSRGITSALERRNFEPLAKEIAAMDHFKVAMD